MIAEIGNPGINQGFVLAGFSGFGFRSHPDRIPPEHAETSVTSLSVFPPGHMGLIRM